MLRRTKSIIQPISSQTTTATEGSKCSAGTGEKVTPLTFDTFVPWVCKQWKVTENVSVLRIVQEDKAQLKKSVEVSPSPMSLPSHKLEHHTSPRVLINAHYDAKDRLVEISIINCPIKIPRKVILAFSLSTPFHQMLTGLTICKGGLDHHIIYEINKLLLHSNITTICLDDSYVPEGNYYILLEETSQLSYLSLNRCQINDEVCKRIAMKLIFGNHAANCLRALELSSNNITDRGVRCMGTALRSNRCLLHLNLAGNKITDDGALVLLDCLMDFRLTGEEVLDMKRRKIKFIKNKQSIYKRYLEDHLEQMEKAIVTNKSNGGSGKLLITKLKKSPIADSRTLKPEDYTEKMSNAALGEFEDPFSPANIEVRDGCFYSKGNFVLCSLNLAYNDLHYPSLQKLDEVVTYQIVPPPSVSFVSDVTAAGLLRVVIDGNFMPDTCDELDRIEFYLKAKRLQRTNRSKQRASPFSSKGKIKKKSQVVFNK